MIIKRSPDITLQSGIKPSEITSKEVYQSRRRFLQGGAALALGSGLGVSSMLASQKVSHAASHFSNRAPRPTIHLIREDMLSRVLGDFPAPEAIPERNIEPLEGLGVDEIQRRWDSLVC